MTQSFFTNQNFLIPELVNAVSASSEATNFASTNLYNSYQRTRTWRSDGYYAITSSNKDIVFRETALTDLTASIAEANYTSSTTFAAAVKAALEATGASTYTVEIDSTTGKWKITSDLSGGGGIFELMWTDVASTAADVLGYSTAADDTGADNYTADSLSIHTEEWLLWDLGLPTLPNALFIFDKRGSAIPLTSGSTLTLEANTTDNFSSPAYTTSLTYDERVINKYDITTGLGSTPYRYWRLKIEDSENSLGYVQLGSIFLSNLLVPTRGRVQFGFNVVDQDFSDNVRGLGGQVFSNSRAKSDSYALSWRGLTKQDKELFQDHFLAKGTHTPFVMVLDPNEAATTEEEILTRLVRYITGPSYRIISPNNWSIDMQLEEML